MNTGLVERDQHLRAFARYESMGRGRSLRQLAAELGVAKSAAEGWSRAFRWRERLAVCRRAVAEAVAGHSKQVAEDQMHAARSLVRGALAHVAKALVQEGGKASLGDVDRMIRLNRELEGEPWRRPGQERRA